MPVTVNTPQCPELALLQESSQRPSDSPSVSRLQGTLCQTCRRDPLNMVYTWPATRQWSGWANMEPRVLSNKNTVPSTWDNLALRWNRGSTRDVGSRLVCRTHCRAAYERTCR